MSALLSIRFLGTGNSHAHELGSSSSVIEKEGVYFRSNRLFAVNHDWYFATREGENIGPFKDRNQAELALAAFIARCISEGDSHSVATRNDDGNEVLNDMVEEAGI